MISQIINKEIKLFAFFITLLSIVGALIIRMTDFDTSDFIGLILVQLANLCFASGQVLWSRIHGGNQDDESFGVVEAYDGGFNIVGRSDSFGNSRVNWLIKTDSQGNVN